MFVRKQKGRQKDLRRVARDLVGSESEVADRALVWHTLGPGLAPVTVNDALDGGESDAMAFVFAGGMKALKGAEQFVHVFHFETNPIVPDEELGFAVRLRRAEFDARRSLVAAEFP